MGKAEAESYSEFVPELGLESGPSDLDQFLSLVPRFPNEGILMSLQVRHRQPEMYPIRSWLL